LSVESLIILRPFNRVYRGRGCRLLFHFKFTNVMPSSKSARSPPRACAPTWAPTLAESVCLCASSIRVGARTAVVLLAERRPNLHLHGGELLCVIGSGAGAAEPPRSARLRQARRNCETPWAIRKPNTGDCTAGDLVEIDTEEVSVCVAACY